MIQIRSDIMHRNHNSCARNFVNKNWFDLNGLIYCNIFNNTQRLQGMKKIEKYEWNEQTNEVLRSDKYSGKQINVHNIKRMNQTNKVFRILSVTSVVNELHISLFCRSNNLKCFSKRGN